MWQSRIDDPSGDLGIDDRRLRSLDPQSSDSRMVHQFQIAKSSMDRGVPPNASD
jgi:hypothetical protein